MSIIVTIQDMELFKAIKATFLTVALSWSRHFFKKTNKPIF